MYQSDLKILAQIMFIGDGRHRFFLYLDRNKKVRRLVIPDVTLL